MLVNKIIKGSKSYQPFKLNSVNQLSSSTDAALKMLKILFLLFTITIIVSVSVARKNNRPLYVSVPPRNAYLQRQQQHFSPSPKRYEPNWQSLDTRPLPQWFDDAKIGIFLHWGVFSVPSFRSEWFWANWKSNASDVVDFIEKNYPPGFTYQEFAKDFTAEFYDPDDWASLFKKSGAKYVVLTSKHHEGFTLWPSKYSWGWNALNIGPRRDVLGDLAQAVRKQNLTFGVYHSLFEWYNPLYESDKYHLYLKKEFVNNKLLPEMYELINTYQPDVLWSDGDWEAFDIYWNSTQFLAWLYNDSPVKDTIVTNDRWGIGIPCKHGDFYSCEDRYNPGVLQNHKWENAMTLDRKSWGYRREAKLSDYLNNTELLTTLAQTISCGGNLLINVGPTKEGTIVPIFEERLLALGNWLEINGAAIYKSKPWTAQKDALTSSVWYTMDDLQNVYAIVLEWPKENRLLLQSVNDLFQVSRPVVVVLGNEGKKLEWNAASGVVQIVFPDKATVKSKDAWVLKITP